MDASKLIIIIVVFLFVIVFSFYVRYSLIRLKSKIELTKKGVLRNKRIDRLISKMNKLGKFRFYIFQGIITWGLFVSIAISILHLLGDILIDKEEVNALKFLVSFLIYFVVFSFLGLLYARAVWKAYKE